MANCADDTERQPGNIVLVASLSPPDARTVSWTALIPMRQSALGKVDTTSQHFVSLSSLNASSYITDTNLEPICSLIAFALSVNTLTHGWAPGFEGSS
jgi:hypothetical protein